MTPKQRPPVIEGHLTTFWETGTEGVFWAVQADTPVAGDPKTHGYHAFLYLLQPGDSLEIFRSDGSVQWADIIEWDGDAGWRRFLDGKTKAEILAERPDDLSPRPVVIPPDGLLGPGGRYAQHLTWVATLPLAEQPPANPEPPTFWLPDEPGYTVYPPRTLDEAQHCLRMEARQRAWAEREAVHRLETALVIAALEARSPHLTAEDRLFLRQRAAHEASEWRGRGQQSAGGQGVYGIQRGFSAEAWGACQRSSDPPQGDWSDPRRVDSQPGGF